MDQREAEWRELDDPHWAILCLRLTEPGGLTGWGVIAMLISAGTYRCGSSADGLIG